jgi:hypothetical protein
VPQAGAVLFLENWEYIASGSMFNDGVSGGSVSRDANIVVFGLPTMRIDPQGNSAGIIAPPTQGPNTSGVVFKRRIANISSGKVTGRYSLVFWMRFTSANWIGNANGWFAAHLYNRDGTNSNLGKVWINSQASSPNQKIQISDGTSNTWVDAINPVAIDDNLHTYDPQNVNTLDTAGEWHYCKLIVDFDLLKYISVQFDELTVALTNKMNVFADTGPRAMHFGFEVGQNGAAQRFLHVGPVIGRVEK